MFSYSRGPPVPPSFSTGAAQTFPWRQFAISVLCTEIFTHVNALRLCLSLFLRPHAGLYLSSTSVTVDPAHALFLHKMRAPPTSHPCPPAGDGLQSPPSHTGGCNEQPHTRAPCICHTVSVCPEAEVRVVWSIRDMTLHTARGCLVTSIRLHQPHLRLPCLCVPEKPDVVHLPRLGSETVSKL